MTLEGDVLKLGDDVDTDQIIPARHCRTEDEAFLGAHLFENIGAESAARFQRGGIIIAGENFGAGSAREHAPLAIKGAGITCVIAQSFSRTFYRNAINIGLPILISAEALSSTEEGDHIEVDLEHGLIHLAERELRTEPFPPIVQAIISAGGLVNFTRERLRHTGRLKDAGQP